MTESVLARLATLKTMPMPALKQHWRDLFDREPPGYNRPFLESRLAYRIQELAYGGLKPETIARLEALGEQFDGGNVVTRRTRFDQRPIAGTKLIREWQGVEQSVTVLADGYEWKGRPFKSSLISGARDHWHALERLDFLRPEKSEGSAVTRREAGGGAGAGNAATKGPILKRRCGVYTRKSSEEGLELEFNSLDAQREACESYIASQKAEGWLLVPDRYDDGGFSGGTLERPALKRLLANIEQGRVDVIVVYKIDRLSRSLADFMKLVEVFDRKGIAFVSVTQSFNTKNSMGRLMLNVLLSFAQFEREVIGERIRDKFAASRRKGMWMGGWTPLGYEVKDRKLVLNETEAAKVRWIFERFVQCGSATTVVRELNASGFVNKYGQRLDKGRIYKLLNNRVYIGDAVHKGASHPGEHEAIISEALWQKVHAVLAESPRARAGRTRASTPALLKGLIFDPMGAAMSPTHTRRRQKLYRYYVSQRVLKEGKEACPIGRVPAAEIEAAVIDQLRVMLRAPEVVVATWRAARQEVAGITEEEVREALHSFDALWGELFPVEQARIVRLLVERVDVGADSLAIRLRTDGLTHLYREISGSSHERRAA